MGPACIPINSSSDRNNLQIPCNSGATSVYLWGSKNLIFSTNSTNMFTIDCPWNYLLYSTSAMLFVIFHIRGRVFHQGLQRRKNNKNHEAVERVIFIILSRL